MKPHSTVLFLPVVFGPSRSTLKAHKVGLGVKPAQPLSSTVLKVLVAKFKENHFLPRNANVKLIAGKFAVTQLSIYLFFVALDLYRYTSRNSDATKFSYSMYHYFGRPQILEGLTSSKSFF
eukprot:SAG11_NODE_9031_length_951_cov_1.448357_1_plen_121_part_00